MIELLSTKFFIPRPRTNLVSRPRLTERLNAGLEKKLTLIAAPAGFGKTTLLSEWIPYSPRSVTWLSLDEYDNDPTKFWSYFIASLQALRPNLGDDALALLQSPQAPPITSILTILINEIAACSDNFVIVLDDYHLVDSQSIHEALRYFLAHLPANLHLMMTTRVDPPLPLARLRAGDKLTELRANDLRFTAAEIATFLSQVMGLELSAQEIVALETRTEGWIAGLQIAGLSMQGNEDIPGFIQAFSGSHRHILGYLAAEVLHQQPKRTLNFLLKTSILDRLCGPLCDTVTGDPNGQSILENLEHANLFITPLDDDGRWYRYHHLFAEVLRARLQRSQHECLPELHNRARQWLEQNGYAHEAVNHAIAGRDFKRAAYLIEKLLSDKWQSGELNTLQSWLADLPGDAWRAHPRLWLVDAWIAITVGDFPKADANLRAAEEALALLDDETAAILRPEVVAFRASYASLIQDPNAIKLARQALRELPADYWLRGMLAVFLAAAYYSTGDLDAALEALAQAPGSSLSTPGEQPHHIHLLAFGGTVLYAKGRLREAIQLLNQAVELAEPGGTPIPFVGTLMAYMSLGPVLYELNDLEQARIYLTRCLELAIDFGSAEAQIYALSFLARVHLAEDDKPAALESYNQIDVLLQAHDFSPSIMANIDYNRFQLYLKQNNLTAVTEWIGAHADQSGPVNPYALYRLALPQMQIAQGDFNMALENLSELIQEALDTGHGHILINALVLQALALRACSQHDQALITLERALILAEPEGFVRTFLDEGEAMRLLLADYHAIIGKKLSAEGDNALYQILAYTEKLLAAFSQPVDRPAQEPAAAVEPLSERELEVLHFLSIGLSNKEIADRLVIATSTVKSHINNLYAKLGVHKRTQAVAIARDLGLLSK
jgi:LuxR family maltose regulon positive regulatory protein